MPTWTIVCCQVCSARYACPRPTAQSITTFYVTQMLPDEWEQEYYVEIHPRAREGWGLFAEKLAALRGATGSLLDVGCAAGWLVKAARDRGWDAIGLEATPKFHSYATGVLRVPAILGTIDDLDTTRVYDVVVMMDVIEHLHDPVGDLARIRQVVAPEGYLVLATCDIESLCARYYGLSWRQIVPSHTVYWTRRSMTLALQRAGFRVEHMSDPRYWDPDARIERRHRVREVVKLVGRGVLLQTYVPLVRRVPALTSLPALVTRGRIDHRSFMFRIGDQPVLGDVMLVIARPA